jgi:hypothetical protein
MTSHGGINDENREEELVATYKVASVSQCPTAVHSVAFLRHKASQHCVTRQDNSIQLHSRSHQSSLAFNSISRPKVTQRRALNTFHESFPRRRKSFLDGKKVLISTQIGKAAREASITANYVKKHFAVQLIKASTGKMFPG